jgi:signal transduction histidine kinase
VHHPEHIERVKAKLAASFSRGEEWEDTFPLRGRDGNYRWFLSRAVPIHHGPDKIKCWFGTNTDITELREAREALAESHAELENRVEERTASLKEAIAQMEEFSYSISHDLRAPVRAMAGYAQATLDEYAERLDALGRAYLERIIRGSSRMDRLILDLLTYSRLARSEIQLERVPPGKLIQELLQQYRELQPPQAEVTVREPMHAVLAHEPSLNRAISNLLMNGVKFVARGTTPQLQVWTEQTNGKVRLWVEDNGIGVKPEHQRRLFGMFERVHQDPFYDGTGIGLAIVRKAAEKMGGRAGMKSDGITGSSFWIELPAADQKETGGN